MPRTIVLSLFFKTHTSALNKGNINIIIDNVIHILDYSLLGTRYYIYQSKHCSRQGKTKELLWSVSIKD